jgi:hypothetical protein
MLTTHRTLGLGVIGVCAGAALVGGLVYWRRRADGRRASDQLHYVYGSLALAVALAPWFYAPESGPRRLLWFAGLTAVAGALAVRAYLTGQ